MFVRRMKQRPTDAYIWMFFPMKAGESIQQAWLRKMNTDSVLVVSWPLTSLYLIETKLVTLASHYST